MDINGEYLNETKSSSPTNVNKVKEIHYWNLLLPEIHFKYEEQGHWMRHRCDPDPI